MNLHLLRVFVAVVEWHGFSKAAETLHISQPAVSKAVRELEHQLGLVLLERGSGRGRALSLTADGESLYQHARGIFSLERAAIEDVRDRLNVRKGRVRVGASTTVAGYWLPEPLADFSIAHPGIELELVVGNTTTIARAILDGHVDLALVEGVVNDPAIAVSHWRTEDLCVVGGPQLASSLSLQQIADQAWLTRETGSGTAQVGDRLLERLGIQPRRRLRFGSNEAIARAVAAGAGCAVLPWVVADDLLALGRLVVLDTPGLTGVTRELAGLKLRDRPASPAMTAVWQQLEQAPGALPLGT